MEFTLPTQAIGKRELHRESPMVSEYAKTRLNISSANLLIIKMT
jgi:hypothetical protein